MTANSVDRLLERMPWLDQASKTIEVVYEPVAGELAPQGLKDALVGTWLGHPLHPAVILMPIGCWTSALILDLAGEEDAADLLIASGLVSAIGAAVTGAAQYVDATTNEQPRRLGALHAMTNSLAMGLYGASYWARKRGAHGGRLPRRAPFICPRDWGRSHRVRAAALRMDRCRRR
jgi:hypothetical protein